MTLAVVLLLGAVVPPALTAPDAAAKWAESAAISPMTRAETLLFARDPAASLDALLTAEVPRVDPRRIRLELDAHVALGHLRLGADRADALEIHDGWGVHARRQRQRLEEASTKRGIVRFSMILFATCLAALGLTGARGLLRPHFESVVFAVVVVAAVVVVRTGSGILATLVALPGIASLALVHAAAATVRRTGVEVRGRMLATALVLIGGIGAFAAVVAQIGPQQILALLTG